MSPGVPVLSAELSRAVVRSHQDISMYGGERHPAGDAHTCERMTQSPPCAAAGHTTFCLSVSELRLALLSFFLFSMQPWASFKLRAIPLFQSPQCQDYRNELSCLISLLSFSLISLDLSFPVSEMGVPALSLCYMSGAAPACAGHP